MEMNDELDKIMIPKEHYDRIRLGAKAEERERIIGIIKKNMKGCYRGAWNNILKEIESKK
jgi:hypothetical protein